MRNRPYWGDTGEERKFSRENASAILSYIIVDGIYYLDHLDNEGWDFLKSLDFSHEIILHKDNGDQVRMVIVDIASFKAKVKP